ncbi:endonuclease-8 [Nakamurella sp. UYEF19]|uniref:DNA-formamidopyrimidine glycosylase family protein n=1 Tax=Nakamurella sp. UYEF19 TaxID=1756392 RepID=UPI0033967FE6
MPEGDTVLRTARRMDAALAGRPLVRAELRWPDLGDVDLVGLTVHEVTAHGKHLLVRFEEGAGSVPLTLHSHFKMEGKWTIAPPGPAHWPRATGVAVRAVLANQDWTAIGTWLGQLDLVPTAAEEQLIGHLGPDVMSDSFPEVGRPESIARLLKAPARAIGAGLLDQTAVAGIGTMYMAETLFVSRLSPWMPTSEVDVGTVLDTARRLMLRGVTSAVQSTTGNTRQGMTNYVHARSGKSCTRCGATVRVAMIGPADKERTAFYCPVCQPGPTPTDDGRRQSPLGSTAGTSKNRRPAGYRRR